MVLLFLHFSLFKPCGKRSREVGKRFASSQGGVTKETGLPQGTACPKFPQKCFEDRKTPAGIRVLPGCVAREKYPGHAKKLFAAYGDAAVHALEVESWAAMTEIALEVMALGVLMGGGQMD